MKQNIVEVRRAIVDAGIEICPCTAFVDAVWLDYYPSVGNVHGLGYPFEGMTVEETFWQIQHEWELYNTEVIECKNVQEFIENIKASKNGDKAE